MYSLLGSTHSPLSVDCVQCCPLDQNLFAFAFYQKDPQMSGGVAVRSIRKQQGKDSLQLDIALYGPILHLCWIDEPFHHQYLLAACCRSDRILLLSYNQNSKALTQLRDIEVAKRIFCLYLDCSFKDGNLHIIMSSNESTVYQIRLDSQLNVASQLQHKAHEFAVWSCKYNHHSKSKMFACGDEVKTVYLYDDVKCVARNNKTHREGICDVTFKNQWELYTGGFDGILSCLDIRKFSETVWKCELGGIVWRVIPSESGLLICNSSEKKFQIVDEASSKLLWTSESCHDSLAYAASSNSSLLVTASFYDKVVCVWQRNKPIQE